MSGLSVSTQFDLQLRALVQQPVAISQGRFIPQWQAVLAAWAITRTVELKIPADGHIRFIIQVHSALSGRITATSTTDRQTGARG
ncbi:hypothetical protein MB02_06215 [Croceicoccus estronivorus]|nr:hypothetical protein MB02_06215 [Croceicoccus estronivorus]